MLSSTKEKMFTIDKSVFRTLLSIYEGNFLRKWLTASCRVLDMFLTHQQKREKKTVFWSNLPGSYLPNFASNVERL